MASLVLRNLVFVPDSVVEYSEHIIVKNHTNITPVESYTHTEANDVPHIDSDGDPCLAALNVIRKRQECFFGKIICSPSPGPLYNYAYYRGQGFGRLIEHSTGHCLTAAALSRPCIIDVDPRDEHYTWRSFMDLDPHFVIEASDLWDGDVLDEVNDAIAKLEGIDWGHWVKNNATNPIWQQYAHVFPMEHDKDTPIEDQVKLWEGLNELHGTKALLSPNWGTAWFGSASFEIPGVTKDDGKENVCHRDYLYTLLQNEIYKPGKLAMRYHRNELRRISESNNITSYGAIHLRTYFSIKGGKHLDEIIQDLELCLLSITNVNIWWLLIDNPSYAENVTLALNNHTQLRAMHNETTLLEVMYGYDLNVSETVAAGIPPLHDGDGISPAQLTARARSLLMNDGRELDFKFKIRVR